ncbi:MAG: sulfotransferase [Pseudomonadota bacterium]
MAKPQPIFILGSARSGTTLMASIVASSQSVAEYRAETLLLHRCDRYYGKLADPAAKERFVRDWLQSRQFKRASITEETARSMVAQSSSYAELLEALMTHIARTQDKTHWIDSTPSNVFEMQTIVEQFPNAKIINVVRDGRAVAASLRKLGWTSVGSRSSVGALQYAALKWASSVQAFQQMSYRVATPTLSVQYESLISEPVETLRIIRDYIDLPDITLVTSDSSGKSTVASNSAFGRLDEGISTEPMTRWRKQLSSEEILAIEAVVGRTLEHCGYPLIADSRQSLLSHLTGVSRKILFDSKAIARQILPFRSLYKSPLEIGMD